MLNLLGRRVTLCDGVSRRGFLKIGSLGLGSLSLANLLQANGGRMPRKSVILFWMAGGPSHIDTYDMKPAAPIESAGPFRPIRTKVSGIDVCELLPRHAALTDRMAIIRSLAHEHGVHDDASHWVQSGHPLLNARERGQQQPAQGAVISHLLGPNRPGMPAYVSIPEAYSSRQGFYQLAASLGKRHDPVNGGGDPALGNYRLAEFSLPADLSMARLEDRRQLNGQLENLRNTVEASAHQGMTEARRRAFDLITGEQARTAFDLRREPENLRVRYGRHAYGQSALLARRLVEAGVTFVTINLYEKDVDWWDDHFVIEQNLRKRLPTYDQALSTLLEDLQQRGLADDVLVAAFGEFGRSPYVDKAGGRGHWPRAMSALLSGGGIRGGQIIGSTTANGGEPRDRRLGPGDLLASIYRVFGISHETMLPDRQNRPMRLVEAGQPIDELF